MRQNNVNRKPESRTRQFFAIGLFGIFFLVAALLLFKQPTQAALPPVIITYQGKVLTSSLAVTTTLSMKFVIYNASSGGTAVYTAAGTLPTTSTISVTPSSGLFSVDLGGSGTNSLDPSIFQNNQTLYLEVTVGSETLSPRKQITAAPYAYNAKYLDGVAATSTASSSTYIPISDALGNFNLRGVTSTGLYVSGTTTLTNLKFVTSTIATDQYNIGYDPNNYGGLVFAVPTSTAFYWLINGDQALVLDTNRLVYNRGRRYSSPLTAFRISLSEDAGVTAGEELADATFEFSRTVTHNTGSVGYQRSFYIGPPTHAFTGASTVSRPMTMQIYGPPAPGTNATFLHVYGLSVDNVQTTGASTLMANLNVNSQQIKDGFGNVIDYTAININEGGSDLTVSLGNTAATITNLSGIRIPTTTYSSSGATRTVTNAASLYIGGTPTNGGGVTFTNTPLALWVATGTSQLDGALTVNHGAIMASGTTGDTPGSAAGTRFMWIPAKAALRAGQVVGTEWDSSNIGSTSTALGYGVTASGATSMALGVNVTASATSSLIIGLNNTNSTTVNLALPNTLAVVGGNVIIGSATASPTGYKLYVNAGGTASPGIGVDGYVKGSAFITGSTTLDLAETYPIDPGCYADGSCPQPGDAVCLASSGGATVEKCSMENSARAIGIISTAPGFTLGGFDTLTNRKVALAGRVPLKVSTKNGIITVGDRLTTSDIPGVAAKALGDGPTIGIALENYIDASQGTIVTFVNIGWNKSAVAAINSSNVIALTVSSTESGQLVTNNNNLNLGGNLLLGVKAISSYNNRWTIDEHGRFITRVQTSQGERDLYALQSPTWEMVLSGSGQLSNGTAKVLIDEALREVIDSTNTWKVSVTLTSGEAKGLYVSEKTPEGFTVEELQGGTSNATFDWMVVVKRGNGSGSVNSASLNSSNTPPNDSASASNPTPTTDSPVPSVPVTDPNSAPAPTTNEPTPAPSQPAVVSENSESTLVVGETTTVPPVSSNDQPTTQSNNVTVVEPGSTSSEIPTPPATAEPPPSAEPSAPSPPVPAPTPAPPPSHPAPEPAPAPPPAEPSGP